MTDSMNGAKLRISVVVPPQALGLEWQKLLLTYVPLSLLAGALLAWAAYRLQRSRQSYREQLRRAMAAGEFHVEYQPVYSQVTGRFEGVEALMRWMRPGTGLVRPDIFIAAAEQEGVIIELTQHLLGLIERDMREWDTPPGFHVGVNIAPEHLSSEDLVPDVRAFVAATAARQPLLVLEITERSLIEDSGRARRNIDTLRAEGVRVAIDDFGTGHCSLSYLQKFPVDYLKIDKGFVHAIQPDGEEAPVLDVIIMLAHRLGLSVVAEGVEQRFQFDYLTERGVAFIQGYLFSRPLRSADFMAWYAGQARSRSCRISRRRAGRCRALRAARARAPASIGAGQAANSGCSGTIEPADAGRHRRHARSLRRRKPRCRRERAAAAPGPAPRDRRWVSGIA